MIEQHAKPAEHATARPGASSEELFRRFARTRDPALRRQLIETHLPLARHLANRHRTAAEPVEDLFQVACLALVKAVDRYDPTRGHAFASYATPTIQGELLRHHRDRTWMVRPPRRLLEAATRVQRAIAELSRRHARSPTVREIGSVLGMPEADVLEAMEAAQARESRSLDDPVGRDGAELNQFLGGPDPGYERIERQQFIGTALAVLTTREARVVRLRFEDDLTQRDIARIVGLSQMQVSRILRGALAKLRGAGRAWR